MPAAASPSQGFNVRRTRPRRASTLHRPKKAPRYRPDSTSSRHTGDCRPRSGRDCASPPRSARAATHSYTASTVRPPSLQRDCHPAPTRTRHAVDPPTSKATIRPAPFGKASTPSSTRAPPAQPNVNFGEPREIDLDLYPYIDMLQSDTEMADTAPSSKAAPARSASEKEHSKRRTVSSEMRY